MDSRKIVIHQLGYHLNTWGNPQNPKLFLLHGWMDSGAGFHFVCQYLKEDFYCIAPDFRGFGKTEHTRNPLGYFFYEYLADLHALFSQIAPSEKIRAVGHSMGANVLSLYAGAFPEQISHFVNIEGFGPSGAPAAELPSRLAQWIRNLHSNPSKIYKTLEEIAQRFQRTNPRLTDKRARFLALHASEEVPGGYRFSADPKHKWASPYIIPLEHYQACWEKITARCLVVTGEEVEYRLFPDAGQYATQNLKERLSFFPSHTQFIEILGAGHRIPHEKPKELAQAISTFLKTES